MRVPFVVLGLALVLAGCQSSGPQGPALSNAPFDTRAAAYIKKPGEGRIVGHAFWRDDKGGVIEAAGETIRLVPATDYARQRFAALYGGGRSIAASRIPKITPDPLYAEYTRTTRAESNGRFEFDGVAPGEYFVTAQVKYRERPTGRVALTGVEGGAMYESVTIPAGADKPVKLVVTNDR